MDLIIFTSYLSLAHVINFMPYNTKVLMFKFISVSFIRVYRILFKFKELGYVNLLLTFI